MPSPPQEAPASQSTASGSDITDFAAWEAPLASPEKRALMAEALQRKESAESMWEGVQIFDGLEEDEDYAGGFEAAGDGEDEEGFGGFSDHDRAEVETGEGAVDVREEEVVHGGGDVPDALKRPEILACKLQLVDSATWYEGDDSPVLVSSDKGDWRSGKKAGKVPNTDEIALDAEDGEMVHYTQKPKFTKEEWLARKEQKKIESQLRKAEKAAKGSGMAKERARENRKKGLVKSAYFATSHDDDEVYLLPAPRDIDEEGEGGDVDGDLVQQAEEIMDEAHDGMSDSGQRLQDMLRRAREAVAQAMGIYTPPTISKAAKKKAAKAAKQAKKSSLPPPPTEREVVKKQEHTAPSSSRAARKKAERERKQAEKASRPPPPPPTEVELAKQQGLDAMYDVIRNFQRPDKIVEVEGRSEGSTDVDVESVVLDPEPQSFAPLSKNARRKLAWAQKATSKVVVSVEGTESQAQQEPQSAAPLEIVTQVEEKQQAAAELGSYRSRKRKSNPAEPKSVPAESISRTLEDPRSLSNTSNVPTALAAMVSDVQKPIAVVNKAEDPHVAENNKRKRDAAADGSPEPKSNSTSTRKKRKRNKNKLDVVAPEPRKSALTEAALEPHKTVAKNDGPPKHKQKTKGKKGQNPVIPSNPLRQNSGNKRGGKKGALKAIRS